MSKHAKRHFIRMRSRSLNEFAQTEKDLMYFENSLLMGSLDS